MNADTAETAVSIIEQEVITRESPAEVDEVGRVLLEAAEIVRRGWCQGALVTSGGKYCVLGALNVVTCGDVYSLQYSSENLAARKRLRESLGIVWLHTWNNAPGRTAEEVAEALERAACGL